MNSETEVRYRFIYWSTRKKGDIDDPYGQADFQDMKELKKTQGRIEKSKDIYKTEVWERTAVMEREKIVEKFHGNPAHLKLNNARMESDE